MFSVPIIADFPIIVLIFVPIVVREKEKIMIATMIETMIKRDNDQDNDRDKDKRLVGNVLSDE